MPMQTLATKFDVTPAFLKNVDEKQKTALIPENCWNVKMPAPIRRTVRDIESIQLNPLNGSEIAIWCLNPSQNKLATNTFILYKGLWQTEPYYMALYERNGITIWCLNPSQNELTINTFTLHKDHWQSKQHYMNKVLFLQV